MNTLIGIKQKMIQTFVDDTRVGVSVIKTGPCIVTQVKTTDRDGYNALQVALGSKKAKNSTKALLGHVKGAIDENAPRFVREVSFEENDEFKKGDKITVADVFSVGDTVMVTATSKGKGFAGGVKRWSFAGGPKTHGQSDRHRAPGSIGQGTTPGRVYKGKKMAGHMGVDTITIKNLKVVAVDAENNTLHVSGPIPGSQNALVTIKRTSPKQTQTNESSNEEN